MTRRVAALADGTAYVGPYLARALATAGHDLVVGDPAPGLVDELEAAGVTVTAVDGTRDLARPGAAERLVEAALDRFGRLDAAAAFTGVIVVGRFLDSSAEDLRTVLAGCVEAPYRFLRAVVPVMAEAGDGQVLCLTSASGARVTPGAPLYSSARAAANHLVRNVAHEVAARGVQVNAVGTNFMDFPEFLRANRVTDEESRARVTARVPMRRLGGMEELARFCLPFLDGTSRFATGQFVAFDGGWSSLA